MTIFDNLLARIRPTGKAQTGLSDLRSPAGSDAPDPGTNATANMLEKPGDEAIDVVRPPLVWRSPAELFGHQKPCMQVLLERHGAIVLDRQMVLESIPGWFCRGSDLQKGLALFGDDMEVPVQILGVFHKQSCTWKWAWTHGWGQQHFNLGTWLPDGVTGIARSLHAQGMANGLEILNCDAFAASMTDVHAICIAACALFPSGVYYLNDFGDGVAAFVLETPLPGFHWQMAPGRIASVFMRLNRLFDLNARNALAGYMDALKFSPQEAWTETAPASPAAETSEAAILNFQRWTHGTAVVQVSFFPDGGLASITVTQ